MLEEDTNAPAVGVSDKESEPAVNQQPAARSGGPKALNGNEGFTPPWEIRYDEVKLGKPDQAPPLIIGFDAEWIEEPEEPSDDPDAHGPLDPDALPGNLVLSYQYACRFGGREWSGIIYTRAGAKIRYPNLTEAELARYPSG
jgi:hypothetical protein